MECAYGSDKVAVKLVYYCSKKREVYFKRKDVSEYLTEESSFEMPIKQGFDGNLSYFGYDITQDSDGERILVLRGSKLNKACLKGVMRFKLSGESVTITIPDEWSGVLEELDSIIANKAKEARAFSSKKRIAHATGLTECAFRVFGNQKIYEVRGFLRYHREKILKA